MSNQEPHRAARHPFREHDSTATAAAAEPACPNPRCRRELDAESLARFRCTRCGCVLAGNTHTVKHGRYSRTPPALPDADSASALGRDPELPGPSASNRLRAQLERDQGASANDDEEELEVSRRLLCRRAVELEALARTLLNYLIEKGVLTERGRPRSALTAYLNVIGSQDRVLQRLGLDRRKRPVNVLDLPLADYVAQHPDQGGHTDGPSPDRLDATGRPGQTDTDSETGRSSRAHPAIPSARTATAGGPTPGTPVIDQPPLKGEVR